MRGRLQRIKGGGDKRAENPRRAAVRRGCPAASGPDIVRRSKGTGGDMRLSGSDRDLLSGAQGPAAAFAMDVLVRFAGSLGAARFLDISRAHIDGCLHHGQVSLDFVERLARDGGRVRVPTTLNVGSMDLIHPELIRTAGAERTAGRHLMELHTALGCEPSFTCAPYQTRFRPAFGEQIAWGESNAIVFANSVVGARTNRYGDFVDLCCALTGRAPAFGLHLDGNRRGDMLFRLAGLPASLEPTDALYVAVGAIVGARAGTAVPVIEGLPPPRSEDQLKALGAVAASTGSVALFHAVGVTPEAPTLRDAFGGGAPQTVVEIGPADVRAALDRLSTAPEGAPVTAVSLGTPHYSLAQFERLTALLPGFRPAAGVEVYVSTGREVYREIEARGWLGALEAAGITVLTDTCTYVTAVLRRLDGVVMTDSGKWAHYAPGNLGIEVAFGGLEDCLASAAQGRVVRLRA
jgi:predicted aconitase